jgi:stringent starvation protein B
MVLPPRLPAKKDVALALLEQSTMFVHLDPRGATVKVPVGFKKQPQLVLQVGLNMPVPIPDLEVNDEGIACTLSFSRTPHYCWIPWASVFALVGHNNRGMVWPEDVPKEVAAQAAQQQKKEETPKLRAVPAEAVEDAAHAAKTKKKRARKTAKKAEATKAPKRAAEKPREPARARAAAKAPAQAAGDAPSSTGTEPKRRRELPPYLRVIK